MRLGAAMQAAIKKPRSKVVKLRMSNKSEEDVESRHRAPSGVRGGRDKNCQRLDEQMSAG